MKTQREILRSKNCFSVECSDSFSEYSLSFEDAVEACDEYAEQFKPKWIPISERLPEEGNVLALTSYEKIVCAYFMPLSNEWDISGFDEPKKLNFISNWMGLPELP